MRLPLLPPAFEISDGVVRLAQESLTLDLALGLLYDLFLSLRLDADELVIFVYLR